MLTNSEILKKIAENDDYYQAVLNITKGHSLSDDLYQELLVIIGEYDNEKLNKMYENNHLKFFFVRITLNQWNSNTSPFYTNYRKDNIEKLNYEEEFTYKAEEGYQFPYVVSNITEDLLEELHWYDRELFLMYVKLGSYRAVSEATDIPVRSVGTTLKQTRDWLKRQIKKRI